MRLKLAACEGDTIYAVKSTGELFWYQPGETPSQVGAGWEEFVHVLSGDDGVLYAVRPNGDLLWYQDAFRNGTNAPDGSTGWAANSGSQIGTGWNEFSYVLPGGNGIVYAIRPNGDLLWYQDTLRNGTNAPDGSAGWAPNSGHQIGSGWNQFRHVFSGRNGTLYAIRHNGDLLWYRDVLRDGTNAPDGSTGWATSSSNVIDTGWDQFTYALSGGNGIIYAFEVINFITLTRYQDTHDDGSSGGWVPRTEPQSGWQLVPVEGYCWPLSGSPGNIVEFKVSSILALDYEVTYVRLRERGDGSLGAPMAPSFCVEGRHRASGDEAWRDGCGWETSFCLTIPTGWPSGLYAARCVSPTGFAFSVPFIVKTTHGQRADFLFLANTNTWNAYNQWGGESNYSFPDLKWLSYMRPNPHLLSVHQDHPRGNHMLRGEIWVLDWLDREGYRVDVCTDVDFHNGIDGLRNYRAVILQTHPEYWSVQMLCYLEAYLRQGGTLCYLGGNGIYRIVQYAADLKAFATASWDGSELFRNNGRSERRILGIAYVLVGDPLSYTVTTASHAFFRGTNVSDDDIIGVTGRNGAACGWETDVVRPDPPSSLSIPADAPDRSPLNTVVLATQTGSAQGNMVYYDTLRGGFVFSVGSITFGGSLVVDPVLQRVVRNALDECLQ